MSPDDAPNVVLEYMVADPGTDSPPGGKLLDADRYFTAEPFLDGPVSRRVAVIDFDPDTGAVLQGARFVPPGEHSKFGRYHIADRMQHDANDFQQVSVFGAIVQTMAMFEEKDVLGRPLAWAFKGQQLLVVPRAGVMENAFYHRDSRSLQFFFFKALDANEVEQTIYTCLSPDIIVHETTHAILDGIAPDLYDAMSPQSLALHEGIADLAAVVFALRSDTLRKRVLDAAGGDLSKAEAFADIALQFGSVRAGRNQPLRNLAEPYSLKEGFGTLITRNEPHDLSGVLSSALYALLVEDHARTKQEIAAAKGITPFSASGLAAFQAGEKFKRMVFRALDYLPPGDISFADYGRALIAADAASNPDPSWERDFVKDQLVKRGIVDSAAELDPVDPGFTIDPALDLKMLVESDWAAYQFAEAHRKDLCIPEHAPIDVRKRLDVTKETRRHGIGKVEARECIYKVAWQERRLVERFGLFDEIIITYGTTLSIDWETRRIRALLSTGATHPSQGFAATERNAAMRLDYLKHCIDEGLVELNGPHAELQGRALKLTGLAQFLHMVEH